MVKTYNYIVTSNITTCSNSSQHFLLVLVPGQAAEGVLEGGVRWGEECQLGVGAALAAAEGLHEASLLNQAHQHAQPEAPEAALKAAVAMRGLNNRVVDGRCGWEGGGSGLGVNSI